MGGIQNCCQERDEKALPRDKDGNVVYPSNKERATQIAAVIKAKTLEGASTAYEKAKQIDYKKNYEIGKQKAGEMYSKGK